MWLMSRISYQYGMRLFVTRCVPEQALATVANQTAEVNINSHRFLLCQLSSLLASFVQLKGRPVRARVARLAISFVQQFALSAAQCRCRRESSTKLAVKHFGHDPGGLIIDVGNRSNHRAAVR